jgi:hypothetical protein
MIANRAGLETYEGFLHGCGMAHTHFLPLPQRPLHNWRSIVIANEVKQSRPYAINDMQIALVVFDYLAMTITGLMQNSQK